MNKMIGIQEEQAKVVSDLMEEYFLNNEEHPNPDVGGCKDYFYFEGSGGPCNLCSFWVYSEDRVVVSMMILQSEKSGRYYLSTEVKNDFHGYELYEEYIYNAIAYVLLKD